MYNKDAITNLSDNDLRACIKEMNKAAWPEDSILRKITIDVYGDGSDDVMHMLGLGVNFALEIEKRTQKAPEMLEALKRQFNGNIVVIQYSRDAKLIENAIKLNEEIESLINELKS